MDLNNTKKELNVVMRLATERDIDTLTDISRICFPVLARWRGPRSHTRKWWKLLLSVDYCEIWVCENEGKIIGYTELTFDKARYANAWVEHKPSIFTALYIFAVCPGLFFRKVIEKIKKRNSNGLKKSPVSSTNKIQEKPLKVDGLNTKKIPWIGPSALLPGMRGKGISIKIHKHCFERAKSLGYKEIYSIVEKENMMSRVMVAILGFVLIKETAHTLFYKKTLEVNHDTQVN